MAARFGAGDDKLAWLVRSRQDTVGRWQKLDSKLVKAASRPPDKRDAAREKRLREELKALDQKLTKYDATLEKEFPEYHELANPQPMKLTEAQALLGPDEALLGYLVGKKESYLWVVRKDGAAMHRLQIGKKEIDSRVQALRRRLSCDDAS